MEKTKLCSICGSDAYLEPAYTKDKQTGWVWVCPNEHIENDDPDNWCDPDFEYEKKL